MAEEKQKLHTLPLLYVQYFRLKFKITGSIACATDVLIQGIKQVPRCKLLLEEMIKFALLHGDPGHFKLVDSIIVEAISPGQDASEGLSAQDKEEISTLYLEFIDLCGSIEDVKNAWNRHIKLFPHSVRTAPSYDFPVPTTTDLKLDRRLDIIVQPSENYYPDHTVSLSIQNLVSLPENRDALFDHTLNDRSHSKVDGSVQEGSQRLLPEVLEQPGGSKPELVASNLDLVHEAVDGTDCLVGSLENLKTSDNQQEQVQESVEASQENPSTSIGQQEHAHESEQDGKLHSLETLSLDPQGKDFLNSIPTEFNEFEASQQTCVSHRSELQDDVQRPISSPMGTEMTDFATEWHCPLSKQQSPVPARAYSQPPVSPENVGNQYKRSNVSSPRFHRHSHDQLHTQAENDAQMLVNQGYSCQSLPQGMQTIDLASECHPSLSRHQSTVPSRSHSQPSVPPYVNQHKRSKVSSPGYHRHSHDQQQLRAQAENDAAQMLVSEGYPCQFLSQVTEAQLGSHPLHQYQGDGGLGVAPHVWKMPNVWPQGFESASSQIPSVAYSSSGTSPVPPQKSNFEYPNAQNWDAYNQIWQYHYYQQQLVLQQQQQQVQVQELSHQLQPEQEQLLLPPELQQQCLQQQQQKHSQQHNQHQILQLQLQQQQYYMQQMQQQQQFYNHLQLQQQQQLLQMQQQQQQQLQQLQAQQQHPNQQELHQERQHRPEQVSEQQQGEQQRDRQISP